VKRFTKLQLPAQLTTLNERTDISRFVLAFVRTLVDQLLLCSNDEDVTKAVDARTVECLQFLTSILYDNEHAMKKLIQLV
jgi:hypothetical protein